MGLRANSICFLEYRKIRDLSVKFSREVQEVWRPQSAERDGDSGFTHINVSPFYVTKLPSMSEGLSVVGDDDTLQFTSHRRLPDKSQLKSKTNDPSDDELFQSIDMDALRRRGRGRYVCLKGRQCDKGGVDKDGNVVVFDRNSVFAYVPLHVLDVRTKLLL